MSELCSTKLPPLGKRCHCRILLFFQLPELSLPLNPGLSVFEGAFVYSSSGELVVFWLIFPKSLVTFCIQLAAAAAAAAWGQITSCFMIITSFLWGKQHEILIWTPPPLPLHYFVPLKQWRKSVRAVLWLAKAKVPVQVDLIGPDPFLIHSNVVAHQA